MNGAEPLAKSSSAVTPFGTVTPTVTSAPKPLTGSMKIGVGTTHSTPPGRTIQGSSVNISKSGSLSTVKGTTTDRSILLYVPVIVSSYSPLERFMVSTTTAPNSSILNIWSTLSKAALAELIEPEIFTIESNSLNPTTLIQAANGKPILAILSGTLGKIVKSGVAQSLLPSLPAKTCIPLADTVVWSTVKDS